MFAKHCDVTRAWHCSPYINLFIDKAYRPVYFDYRVLVICTVETHCFRQVWHRNLCWAFPPSQQRERREADVFLIIVCQTAKQCVLRSLFWHVLTIPTCYFCKCRKHYNSITLYIQLWQNSLYFIAFVCSWTVTIRHALYNYSCIIVKTLIFLSYV